MRWELLTQVGLQETAAEVPYLGGRGYGKKPVVIGVGTVGEPFVRHIAPYSPVVAVARTERTLQKLAKYDENIIPRPGDASDPQQMLELTKDAELVVLTAADMSLAKSDSSLLKNNLQIVKNVIDAAHKHGFTTHFMSSIAAYGLPEKDSPITENEPLNPINSYGESKVEGERLIRESGIPHAIFRPDNIIDYNADVWTHAILTALQEGVRIPEPWASRLHKKRIHVPTVLFDIFGDQAQFDYVVARNIVDLSMLAANKQDDKKVKNQIFNATDGSIPVSQFIRDHQEVVLGKPFKKAPRLLKQLAIYGAEEFYRHSQNPPPALEHVLFSQPGFSGKKAEEILGHTPRISYVQYLIDTTRYIQTNGVRISNRI